MDEHIINNEVAAQREDGKVSDKNELMKKLVSYDFAMKDLNLYLDTHPDDRKALAMYSDVAKTADRLRAEYTKMYGPLCARDAYTNTNRWAWIDEPWPWDNK